MNYVQPNINSWDMHIVVVMLSNLQLLLLTLKMKTIPTDRKEYVVYVMILQTNQYMMMLHLNLRMMLLQHVPMLKGTYMPIPYQPIHGAVTNFNTMVH